MYHTANKPVRDLVSLDPAFPSGSICVVFAANNRFVPIFSACFQSLLAHISEHHKYDVILLQTDISQDNRRILSAMSDPYPNVSLRFFDVSPMIGAYDLKTTDNISVETYFRLLIQSILPGYDKVLYLDCDLIVLSDVAELYAADVDGFLLAAALDPEIAGHVNGGRKDIRDYVVNTLKLADPFAYFQAGVLLLNEAEIRKTYTQEQWLSFSSVPYRYQDQDVLNVHCQGKVKFLDMSWNLITDCDHTRVSHYIVKAPEEIREAYFTAREDPKIVHYAGHRKPWHKPTEDLAHHFWAALRQTPYYEEVLYDTMQFAAGERILEEHRSRSLYWKLRCLLKKIIKRS